MHVCVYVHPMLFILLRPSVCMFVRARACVHVCVCVHVCACVGVIASVSLKVDFYTCVCPNCGITRGGMRCTYVTGLFGGNIGVFCGNVVLSRGSTGLFREIKASVEESANSALQSHYITNELSNLVSLTDNYVVISYYVVNLVSFTVELVFNIVNLALY